MKRALILAFVAAGCGAPEDASYDDVVTNLDDKADNVNSAKAALPAGATHLYFSSPAGAYVSDDAPLSYTWFTAKKGGEFKISVGELDENGNAIAGEHVGFKLQRAVKKNGKWTWNVVAQADNDNGIAATKYKPTSGPGLYLVTATASPLPAQLTVNLACGADNCATAQQPDEACGGLAASQFVCDDGLFCSYSPAQQCGAADQQGVCTVKPQFCPLYYSPVCGCDDQTYGNSCGAHSAGTSVDRQGPCDVNIVGAWRYINGTHFDYTFSADGTFTSEEQPACAFSTPRCLVKIAPASGVYTVTKSALSLSYTSNFRNGETASFAINSKQTHLTGSDWNTKLDLTRVK